jgi:hypothetical protein
MSPGNYNRSRGWGDNRAPGSKPFWAGRAVDPLGKGPGKKIRLKG